MGTSPHDEHSFGGGSWCEGLPGLEPAWKQEMRQALVEYMVRSGMPVENRKGHSTAYGWLAGNWEELYAHLKTCPLDIPKCSYDDGDWYEWGGTFCEDTHKTGLVVKVFCSCGQVAGQEWRMTESYADMLKEITS